MQPIHAGGSRPDVGRSRSGTSRTWAIGARLAGLVLGALTSGALGLVAIPVAGAGASTTTTGSSGGIESLTSIPSANFWLADAKGDVWAFGSAPAPTARPPAFLSTPSSASRRPTTAKGYWLVATDGGIFSYGDAKFYGSTGAIALNRPIVGMASTPTRRATGSWRRTAASSPTATPGSTARPVPSSSTGPSSPWPPLPTARGTGSWPATAASSPTATPPSTVDGDAQARPAHRGHGPHARRQGYWLVASDGGIFAPVTRGSTALGRCEPDPAEKIVTGQSGHGYWVEEQNGTAHPFGDAGPAPDRGLLFAAGHPRRQGGPLASRSSESRTSGVATARWATTARVWPWPRGRTGSGRLRPGLR